MFGDTILHGEVFEEYMPLQRHHLETEIGYCFERAYRYQQKPSEGEAGVHIAESPIDLEDADMEKALTHRLP